MIRSTIANRLGAARTSMAAKSRAWRRGAWLLGAWLLGVALVSVSPGVARAQPAASEATLAEALFREARELMKQERYDAACPKFAESQRLDPGGGTLLNLAICHERQGKLATAWGELREALGQARKDGRADRARIAEQHLTALEPRLPRLAVMVPQGRATHGVRVEVDGVELGRAAWGSPVPVDPGPHAIRAGAAEHKDFRKRVDIGEGESLTIEVPALEPLPGAPPGPGAPQSREEEASGADRQRVAGYVAGALGVAALGAGVYFGVAALEKRADSDAECPTDTTCSDLGVELNDAARRNAWFANIGIGLGLVGIGAGTYLVLAASSGDGGPERGTRGVAVALDVKPGGGAVRVQGRW